MRMHMLTVVALLAACAGDSPPPSGQCTGANYEPCNEEHDCDAQICNNFEADGFQVCSLPCDDAVACPDDGTCDTVEGFCKPAAPVECTL